MSREFELLLFRALAAEHGLRIRTSSPDQLRQRFYKLRKEDSTFADLSFVVPATEKNDILFVVKRKEASDDEES